MGVLRTSLEMFFEGKKPEAERRFADTPYADTPTRFLTRRYPSPLAGSFQPENADGRQKMDRPLENHVFDMLSLGSSAAVMIRFVRIEIGVFASDQGGSLVCGRSSSNLFRHTILICEGKDRVLLRLWK